MDPAQAAEIAGLAVALAIGLLIGLERGWSLRDTRDGTRVAGVRTYGLMALAAATAVMLLRVLVLTAVLAPVCVPSLAGKIVPALLVAAGVTVWRARTPSPDPVARLPMNNPISLTVAIGFAALVAVTIIVSRWAIASFGSGAFPVTIGLTGLYDVDSAIVAVATLTPRPIPPDAASTGLLTAVLVNTVLKGAIVLAAAGRSQASRAMLPLGLSALVLVAGYAV